MPELSELLVAAALGFAALILWRVARAQRSCCWLCERPVGGRRHVWCPACADLEAQQ